MEEESEEPLGAERVMGNSDKGGVGALGNDYTNDADCYSSDDTARSNTSESMAHSRCRGLGYHSRYDNRRGSTTYIRLALLSR